MSSRRSAASSASSLSGSTSAPFSLSAFAVFAFKYLDVAQQKGYLQTLVQRPSEAVEFYLYFFIFAYLGRVFS
jgi:hypothetical protein